MAGVWWKDAVALHEIPLFPLNTVLFPGMPLRLYIFETRYKLMIGECVRNKLPFGVVLIRSGQEVGGSATTYPVGTLANITEVRRLPNGEMDIMTRGDQRFVIEHTHTEKPYLSGIVQDFPLENPHIPSVDAAARRLSPLFKSYLNFFTRLGQVEQHIEYLPDDPLILACLTAFTLNVPAKDKQQLLDIPDLLTLLQEERHMLLREAAILKHLVMMGKRWKDDPTLFSPN